MKGVLPMNWQLWVALVSLAVCVVSGFSSYDLSKKNEFAWAELAFLFLIAFLISLIVTIGLAIWGFVVL